MSPTSSDDRAYRFTRMHSQLMNSTHSARPSEYCRLFSWNTRRQTRMCFNCATNGENTENNGLRERCTRNTVMQMYIKHYLNAVSSSINCDRLDCICQKFHQRDPKVEIFLLLPRLGRCTWWQLFQCRRQ
ncbi:unnamed protein product [Albugo candida]|uniref:Uncharacterized protein n=1 Tax=Albugo candida TaxID=65357 RepID=A0A024GC65_9STRA|nr:unnamed protein product [Albugo candida]|eukprot:CCI43897.1 unnamed protein product [Albugo candida]